MSEPLPRRLRADLPIIDPDRARRARGRLPADALEAWAGASDFLDAVFAAAPYLGRLAARRPATLARLAETSPEAVCEAAAAQARAAGETQDADAAAAALRTAKADLHLAAALADLAGAWDVAAMTREMTRFADAAVQGALAAAARETGFADLDPQNPAPGLFVLALGKHGAGTLNYSSDIDLVCFWEPEIAEAPEGKERAKTFTRLVQRMTRLLQEPTGEGYVFRVDLRLRPDPGATPAAMSAEAARNYFEALGQNWERAAYAKARTVAGDRAAGDAFLADLSPFIWRRTLDFAAVEDIRALAKQIQSVGARAEIAPAGHDLKLGRGGVREIEFYAQVLQLVFGGRRPELRVRDTVGALTALAEADLAPGDEVAGLIADYRWLRALEHRVQMREDEQSQTLPADRAGRAAVAALAGEPDLDAFDAAVTACLSRVHAAFSAQFGDGDSLATSAGSLVLTGVEPTPDTLATLDALGFSEPERVWTRLAGWAAGRARAVRTERARALFSRIAPRLVEAIAATGDPDPAFTRFAQFFEGLPMGVQPLSLLANEPRLLSDLTAMLGLAPRLAESLARRPALLDAMLEPRFSTPLRADTEGEARERAAEALRGADDFEAALNAARRFAREERLRIGAQLLLERAGAEEAGAAYSDLAEACVEEMAKAAEAETARRYGPAPGRWAVVGLGKLGGRELSADSDLDIMVVYAPEESAGAASGAETWFAKFAQRLVSALSAPTEEGELYAADMALRPSGSAGPVAVRLSRLEAYYADEAWTWERMAITRARVVAGDAELGARLETAFDRIVAEAGEPETVRADARDMRARLERDKPAKDEWDLKLRVGGLIDIEFTAQTLQLVQGRRASPNTAEALRSLAAAGVLDQEEADALTAARRVYAAVDQLVRLAHGSGFNPVEGSKGFALRVCSATGSDRPEALGALLESHARRVRAIMQKYLDS